MNKMKRYILLATAAVLILSGCKTGSTSTISEGTTINYLRMLSPFDSNVKSYAFTIDTVNNLIYNKDSLAYGTRVDSLAPMITPMFSTCMIDGETNLYEQDTVYIDFTKEHTITVTSAGEKSSRTYKIWVNVHQVNPDTIEWDFIGELPSDDITRDKCVATEEGNLYWLMDKGGKLVMLSGTNGNQWSEFTTEGITESVDEIDIEHAVAHNEEVCMMAGMTLITSNQNDGWSSQETTSEIEFSHLLFSLGGNLYALGEGNKILRLNNTSWEEATTMPTGFPVRGESVSKGKSPSGRWQVMVACGIDETGNYLSDVWSTENGSYWVKLTQKDSLITPRAFAGMAQYAYGLILFGGTDKDGNMVDDYSLFSKDYGMTWQELGDAFSVDSTTQVLIARREKLSVVPTADGYVIVTGGTYYYPTGQGIPPREKSKKVNDIWKGINYASLPGFKK